MEQEQEVSFPQIDLHDLKEIWRLGNMAQRWAKQPVALGPDEMMQYQETCHRYGLRPEEVLLEFQKLMFGDPFSSGPHAMPDGVTFRPSPEPRHPRHDADSPPQSGDLGWRDETTGLMSGPIDGGLPEEERV